MIEKLALALDEEFNSNSQYFNSEALAKIAIETMLEPTTAMKYAKDHNGDQIHYGYNCNICGGIEIAYKAMMKAALLDK